MELAKGRDEYRVADVQNLGFLSDATFDVAVSYLNQCDLPDLEANNREVFRVLRPGGGFVIANVHPMRSAVGGWQKSGDGRKQHVVLDRYFDEGERHWKMMELEFTHFHRTLETCVAAYLAAGFVVERIAEPTVTAAEVQRYPELEDEMRVPNFVVYGMRLHPPRGWYQEGPPRGPKQYAFGVSAADQRFLTIHATFSYASRVRYHRERSGSASSWSSPRATPIAPRQTSTPDRQSLSASHGQRPWFQRVMRKV